MGTATNPAATSKASTRVFRSVLPNGVVVSTVRAAGVGFETAIVAANGRVSDGVRSATRGLALATHNAVCDGVYGRGMRAGVVLSMLLDVAEGEVSL